jgi:hypothetical protein
MKIQPVVVLAFMACGMMAHADQVTPYVASNVGYAHSSDCGCGKTDDKLVIDCGTDKGCGTKGGCTDGCLCYAEGVEPFKLLPSIGGIEFGGWTQFGYHSDNSFADGFNQYEDHVALHQQWFYAEKVADGSCGLDWGFRFDAMYGIDANNTQAFGNSGGGWDNAASFDHGQYGWALPQAYGELAYGDVSVIFGHFYTLVGYEVVMAPNNFFYSHAFAMNNIEPFTHTGIEATWEATDRLTLRGGWTLGWDTGFDQFEDGNNFLGGFSYELTDNIDVLYYCTIGDFGSYFGVTAKEAYEHTVVVDFTLTERLNYVFETDLLRIGDLAGTGEEFNSFGINNYLFYTLNDCWSFGARLEWWETDLGPGSESITLNEFTVGLNWRPHTNFVLRPEVRQEWFPSDSDAREVGSPDSDQTIFGVDAVVTY